MNGLALALLSLIVLLVGLLYFMHNYRPHNYELEPRIEYIPLKEVYKPWGRYGYAPDWRQQQWQHEERNSGTISGSDDAGKDVIVKWKY